MYDFSILKEINNFKNNSSKITKNIQKYYKNRFTTCLSQDYCYQISIYRLCIFYHYRFLKQYLYRWV